MIRDLTLVFFGVCFGMAINVVMNREFSPCSARTVAHQILPQVK